MPFVVYLLGLAVFTQGTSEFMLSGLIPDIAGDMRISIPAAGLLTSAFAAGMVIGAPLMAALSLRWPRRDSLAVFLLVFIAVHIIGACTGSFALLLGTRIIGALANAGFWAVALATANGLVAADAKGRATAIVVGGVTVANVAGVPAGALIGEYWGWRSAFLAVAIISVPAFIAILRKVPRNSDNSTVNVRGELRLLGNSRLLITLLLGALVNGGTFCAFTYLAPLFTTVTGFDVAWIPAVLALFGIGSFLGVSIGGRIADRYPRPLLLTGMALLLIGWTALALLAGDSAVALALVFVMGIASFATGSTLISRVFCLATEVPTLAGGFATSAFNLGATVGPLFGGMAISTEFGLRAPPLVSAMLAALALVIALGYPRR